ncbi:hypothetical protein TWF730_001839 [Orbilia blumenaviensis]|uniref:Uncharacterized protein n=1 Tax=Orbilia blumenaviensis TaxID=1796055 RepID=A0AAV9UCM6_9PEZI
MEFQFIDGANIDDSARKQIRSSVMKGRNTGKKRPRREPIRPAKPRVLLPNVAGSNRREQDGHGSSQAQTPVSRILATVGNDLTVVRYPKPLEPQMQRVIRQFMSMASTIIYPKELCLDVQESHSIWFEYFQSDEAFFHCLLAMAQAYTDWAQGGQGESIKVMRYLSETYRCINQKLKLEGTPDDPTVAVVMSMTMHNNLLRAPGGAKVHLNALQRMVELRGGLTSFSGIFLIHKICRTDIEFSLQSGAIPRFYRDKFPYDMVRSSQIWMNASCKAFLTATNAHIYNIDIQSIFRDISCASTYMNSMRGTNQRLEPLMFQEILIAMGYRLMRVCPLDGARNLSPADDACQLALLAMVSTMLLRKGISKLTYPSLAGLFRDSIAKIADDPTADNGFLLWLLFLAGVSIFDVKDDAWLLLRIQNIITSMGLRSLDDTKTVLENYPWITYFHDEPALELWDIATKF